MNEDEFKDLSKAALELREFEDAVSGRQGPSTGEMRLDRMLAGSRRRWKTMAVVSPVASVGFIVVAVWFLAGQRAAMLERSIEIRSVAVELDALSTRFAEAARGLATKRMPLTSEVRAPSDEKTVLELREALVETFDLIGKTRAELAEISERGLTATEQLAD